MSMLAASKQKLSKTLLRGPVLDRWIRQKVRRLEGKYVRTLLQNSSRPPGPETVSPLKKGEPLRRMLFVSDIMWEGRELVPELEKFTELKTLNLKSALKQNPGKSRREVVVTALRAFLQENPAFEPDLVLFYARASLLSDEAFDVLRKRYSCPVFGLNLDEKFEFLSYGVFAAGNDNYGHWATKFDLNLSNVRAVVDWYSDRSLPVLYVPEGFHPKGEPAPSSATEYRYPISFVGSRRSEREVFFSRLRAFGVPIEPIGFGWKSNEGCKDPEAVYRTSQMNLGIGFATPSHTLTTLKARDFECPGAGACYLTTYNWELALHYDIGREILCYRSEEELIELFSFYRRRPEACLQIAQAAYRRCLAEHTWEQRFRKAFGHAGFKL